MRKKIVVGLACLLTFFVLIAWSQGTNGQEPAPQPAQPQGPNGQQPAAQPAQPQGTNGQQPAAQPAQPPAGAEAGKTQETAAPATKRAFTEDSKPFLSDRHVTRGSTCASCHGEDTPTKEATTAQCLKCHESYDALSKKTAEMSPNPHSNHIVDAGDVECSFCHHSHKANEVGCRKCHQDMDF